MKLSKVELSEMTLGKYMKRCRERSGHSQRAVSIYLGFTTAQFISNVERNISPLPAKQAVKWLAYIKADKRMVWQLMCKDYQEKTRRILGV